jgi:hypothetical protein
MSGPTKISKQKAITLSLAATGQTGWIPVRGRRLSIAVAWTGTPTGTFSLEAQGADGNAVSIPGASAEFTNSPNAQPAGTASSALWNWSNVPAGNVRIKYTLGSSTGTATLAPVFGE